MNAEQIKLIQSVLGKELGRTWPWFLAECLIIKRKIFRNTHWAISPGEESEFVRRLAFVCAVYLKLQNKFGKEPAYTLTERISIPAALKELLNFLHKLSLPETDGMKHLTAFRQAFENEGAGKFCHRTYISHDNHTCHFIITRCVFYDFFNEAGTPELTRIFCEVDREFYLRAFPSLRFSRGDSWENTIACGRSHCDFIIERKEADSISGAAAT
ncbi:MAG: hypothetical protein FJ139_00830 [Deltaproteobacteria bacterium]|nr:hypothetical protein [Deltaproteobacteria bacterium]